MITDKTVIYGDWSHHIDNGYFWLDDKPTFRTKYDFERLNLQLKITQQEDALIKKQTIQEKFKKFTDIPQSHWYLNKKQALVQPDFKFDWQKNLIIPMYDFYGSLTGYQRITQEGKVFGSGSASKSSLYPLFPHQLADIIILAEGYATSSSIFLALNDYFESKNYTVLCCFSAGNVDRVAALFPHKYVFAIKDNDPAGIDLVKTRGFTVGNEGQDANDVHVECGLDVLTKRIITGLKKL